MTDNVNWLKRPMPFHDESLVSWLRRWSHENLLDSRQDVLRIAGCSSAVRINARDLKALAALMGVDQKQVQAIAPQDAPPIPALRKIHTRPHHEGVCPHCLVEAQYSRQAWSHVLVTACPAHAVRLIALCEQCQEPLAHNRPAAHICRCGADLSLQACAPASEMEIAFSSLLAGKVMPGTHFPFSLDDKVPPDIDHFVIGLVNHFCCGQDGRHGIKLGKSPLPSSVVEAHIWLDHLFALFTCWPTNFEEKLKPYLKNQLALTATGLTTRDGAWFRHIFKRYKHPAYQPVRTCAANSILASECGLLSYRSSCIESNATITAPWIPVTEAAKSLGVSFQRINDGIDRKLIKASTYDYSSSHRQRFLRREEIDRLKLIQQEHFSDNNAIEFLHVSRSLFQLLTEAGLIKRSSVASTPPVVEGYVQRASLSALINMMKESVDKSSANVAGAVIFFRDLNLKRTTNRQRLFELFRSIESGELTPVAHDGTEGIGGFCFQRQAIESKVSSAYVERGLTLEQIKQLTSCHYDAVKAWVELGLLKATQSQAEQGSPWVVELKDLVQFLMTYTPLSHHATINGSTSRGITSKLEGIGVFPLAPASGRGATVRLSDIFVALPASIMK